MTHIIKMPHLKTITEISYRTKITFYGLYSTSKFNTSLKTGAGADLGFPKGDAKLGAFIVGTKNVASV